MNIRLVAPAYTHEHTSVVVPDLDEDGRDDIVVYTGNSAASDAPSSVWLFPGCEAW